MTVRIFTVKRLLIMCLTLATIFAVFIQQNFRSIALNIVNSLAEPYSVRVLDAKVSIDSANQWHFPFILVRYQDSEIALHEVKIQLNNGYNVLKSMKLSLEDISDFSVNKIDVNLGDSFFQPQQQTDNAGSIGLSLSHIPEIKLAAINIYLPFQNNDRAIIQAKHLNLLTPKLSQAQPSPSIRKTLSGEFLLMQQAVANLSLTLDSTQWQLTHYTELNSLREGLEQLSLTLNEYALHTQKDGIQDKERASSSLEQSSFLSTLDSLQSAISTHMLTIKGLWNSTTSIDLITGAIQSKQIINELTISSSAVKNVAFNPASPIQVEINYKPEADTVSPNLNVKLAPISWQQSTDKRQLEQLIQLLQPSIVLPTEKHELIKQLEHPILWQLALTKPLTIQTRLDDQATITANYDAAINISHPVLSADITLKNNHIVKDNSDISFDAEVLSHLKQKQHINLTAMDFIPHEISFENSELTTDISIKATNNTAEMVINSASIYSDKLDATFNHKNLNTENVYWQLTEPSSFTLSQTPSITSSNAALQPSNLNPSNSPVPLNSVMKFNVNGFAFGFDSFSFTQPTPLAFNKPSYEAQLGKFRIEAKQNIELTLNETTPSIDLLSQALSQTNQSTLSWQLNNIKLDKLIPSKSRTRRYKALKFDQINLDQTLSLKQQLLTGTEQWQLDALSLSSYHLLKLPQKHQPASLAGQWSFDTELADILSTFEHTQMLPDNMKIDGRGKLNAGFALIEAQGVSLFEMKFEQQLTNIDAKYHENVMYDATAQANCQFNWQQAHSTPERPETFSQSRLLCQQAQIDIPEAYAGINLDNINLSANLSLGKNEQIPAKNWLQEISGLSDTDVNLTASGDLLDGEFLIPEFYLRLHDISEGYFVLNGISLEALLAAQPQVGVYANGIFDGVLPATLVDGKVTIAGGHLAARKPGGLIQVSNNPALEQIRDSQPHLDFVVQALEHLEYSQLSSTFDMKDNGDASLKVQVKGKSQDIERPIHLNYSHEENLFQLYKSTQIGNQLQNDIERSVK